MAEFNVNSSKNIPTPSCVDQKCDSDGNCYCPTNGDRPSRVPSEFNPLLPVLQLVGAANTAAEMAFGDESFSPPQGDPEISAKSNQPNYFDRMQAEAQAKADAEAAYDSIDWGAYESYATDFNSVREQKLAESFSSLWAMFSNSTSDSTPEQRGQFAAQNIAANVTGGGLPSVPAVEPPLPWANFSSPSPQPLDLSGNYYQFSSE